MTALPAPDVRIVATGLYTPSYSISNEELVESFNRYVERYNADHAGDIEAGLIEPLQPSSAEFIEKASGIRSRYVMDKDGILDIDRMAPHLPPRPNEALAVLAEMGATAAREAMAAVGLGPEDIDAVICAASNLQRAYPAVAVEIQDALGVDGFAFDMNVACASASFGIETARGLIRAGARRVLMVNPEICTAHLNFRNRDSHFIFGDVATAVILERIDGPARGEAYDILGVRLKTVFSNNIRNNFGFLNRCERETGAPADPQDAPDTDKLFIQQGRKVFKDVVPMVGELILSHLDDLGIAPEQVKRFWLHQANLAMNEFIVRKVLGRDASREEAPVVLDEYANTSSAGSIIAFHKRRADLAVGDIGVISGFGAGYSAGSVVVRKAA
ncbi:beta-ketoacyl-ACP synthase III [Amphiplicatus metriothermophilus]|uniref:Beta-ketodecanoyl-[acyl-carrier-protein] synthase n=1 Tax=Amphiplicatus metriothermophilus TaxID=1519374 RepID=A0A239PKV9_9PROT|nr:beta-ketoacyl-ACP synthase III [Amphiplicatus metriothermophilus]MBB5517228.1 beta-ketodecanoyl-[acyl-carrier-protein] synthase [Amphiplicatus metriothermophilus]SNT68436.1 beta-ketodecanoyl-[acyl-carrier-protein] synthase [Amphiplicatus metriothermophilus]